MIDTVLPEEVGVSSADVYAMLSSLLKRKIHMHSILLMRHDKIFFECYWSPFHKDRTHRMYSVTKSFVSVAVGLAEEDGLIDLDATVASYFPEKISSGLGEWLSEQTVRQMLAMTTVGGCKSWFQERPKDRTYFYFNDRKEKRPAGTVWEYDSAGSQVLASLVEKVTGKKLFDYLNERIFKKIGAFSDAKILLTPNLDSWGDSGMICTPRDLAVFARFVMNYGEWNGERLMNENYLRTATSKVVDDTVQAFETAFGGGYGYQFRKTYDDGFAFVGMGNQLAICLPRQDLIFVCTADTQGCAFSRNYISAAFFDNIAEKVSDERLCVDAEASEKLKKLSDSLSLFSVNGAADSPMREKINEKTFECRENPLGWKNFTFKFENAEAGELQYTNERGKMVIQFYVNRNRFGKFCEEGYSREFGGVCTTDGHKYKDAVSCAWLHENKLIVFVQIIDDYFGNLSLTFSFKDDIAVVKAVKNAEDFLFDYDGEAVAKMVSANP